MLYHWLYPLRDSFSLLNVFRYITFRSFVGFALATIISILVGKKFINYMKFMQFGQVIRSVGPQGHLKKAGTPTFGGCFMMLSVVMALIVTGNFNSGPLNLTLLVAVSYFILGLLDDYFKVLKKDPKGISARCKLIWQFATSITILFIAIKFNLMNTKLYVPFVKGELANIGYWYIPFGSLVIVGSSNAVNLTDGLDGLAIGPIVISSLALAFLAYVAGHMEIATYLYVPYVEGGGELAVLAATVIGAGVGFLWYNAYPAQIFMGDAGSLPLGGILGTLAVFTKNEILFVIIGGIFVVEALSVIIQVISFKSTGKRVFKMAPLHHHFELLGQPETKVTVRFWIVSILLAIVSLATIKLR